MLRLAYVLLLLFLIHQLVAQAKLSPTREDQPSSSVDHRSKRTLFNIIWGCISTTIICAWAAIHPNIPPPEGPFKKTLRRLELMFWTLVAPEILPCWALNQRLAAITVRDVYNEAKFKGYEENRRGVRETVKRWFSLHEVTEEDSRVWTVAHGHYLIMGGFHLVEDGNTRSLEASPRTSDASSVPPKIAPVAEETGTDTEKGNKLEQGRTILTLEMLRELVKDPEFNIRITEREINHRSKGDALSKFIFITQSTWFILQCIGRHLQGLNLTQLELTTLALASLNAITFALWWDKPLGAQTLERVYLRRKLTNEARMPRDPGEERSIRSKLIRWIQEVLEVCVTTIHDAFLCRSKEIFFFVWLVHLPAVILLLLLLPIIVFTFAFFTTLRDLAEGTSCSFPSGSTHVPTFYVPKHQYPEWYHILLLMTLGAIFGGIHCSRWNFPFPTYTEQKIWRVASLAVTIFPIATFPLNLIINFIARRLSPTDTVEPFAMIPLLLCALAYGAARFVLLGLALALLRNLHPTAFIAVNWTNFYPHIF